MSKNEYGDFVRKTESLVKPLDSTAISFLGDFNKYLPLKMQKSIMEKGSRKIPYMGFIVDPYCFFLSFPVADADAARTMLPAGYELAQTSLFKAEAKRFSVIISAFSVRTSVFAGMRVECYLIARHAVTGRLAWIIVDYETNTSSHDPKSGFCGYSCDPALFTTTPYGELLVEAVNKGNGNRYIVSADLSGGRMRELDRDLWVEGNLSVDYGGKLLAADSMPFSLIFDPVLMKEAKQLDLSAVELRANTFLKGVIDGERPTSAVFFPYAQHFVIRQDLGDQELAGEDDLAAQVKTFMDRRGFKTMSGDDIKKPLLRSLMISSIVNAAIIIFLAVKLLFF